MTSVLQAWRRWVDQDADLGSPAVRATVQHALTARGAGEDHSLYFCQRTGDHHPSEVVCSEVIVMTSSAPIKAPWAGWAWVAIALTPVGLGLVIALGFAFGEGSAQEIPVSIAANLLGMAAPTVALVLALAAFWGGARSGRSAVIVSSILLAVTLVALPMLATDFGIGWVVALLLAAAVLAWVMWRHQHHEVPPNTKAHAA